MAPSAATKKHKRESTSSRASTTSSSSSSSLTGAAVKHTEAGIEEQILQSNPLLEALGNAKTLRNDNSSRFGKYMNVGFDANFCIQGCAIENYLLEKSRVVRQTPGERNYHIFYFMLLGCSEDVLRQLMLTRDPRNYNYLNTSGCTVIDGLDDAREYSDVASAMYTLNFDNNFQMELHKIVASVLHLGNASFTARIADNIEVADMDDASQMAVRKASRLLGVDADALIFCLSQKVSTMGGREKVTIQLNKQAASDTRDTLSKKLYSALFDLIVSKIDEKLHNTVSDFTIGILDIFGFEVRSPSTLPFIHSFIHPYIHPSIHPPSYSFIHPSIHSSTLPFIHSRTHTHTYNPSFIHVQPQHPTTNLHGI
jgi:myosin heavy subunit